MRYVLDFGSANAGGSPAFSQFARLDTLAAVSAPSITEIGSGLYYFDWDWTTSPATSIAYKVTLAGLELSDVISGVAPPGASTASAGALDLAGYDTVGTIIAKAGVQLALLQLTPSAYSSYDPFASTDPNVAQLLEHLDSLADEINGPTDWTQLIKEWSITTAASGTLYNLPDDFDRFCDQSGWNRSMRLPMIGPLSPQDTQFLKARLGNVLINVAFRLKGKQIEFPVAPANGQTLAGEYVSRYWIVSNGAQTADAAKPSAYNDVVLHDSGMMIAGIKLRWLEAHGFDTAAAQRVYDAKLDNAIGKNQGAKVIRLGGTALSEHWLDAFNLPVTGYGG